MNNAKWIEAEKEDKLREISTKKTLLHYCEVMKVYNGFVEEKGRKNNTLKRHSKEKNQQYF